MQQFSFWDIQRSVYLHFLSKPPPWQNQACELTDTFLHVPLKGLNLTSSFTLPRVNKLHQPQNSQEQNTPALRKERKVRRMGHRVTGRKKKRSSRRGGSSLFRFKGDLSPLHSYPFTLCHIGPWGGMGVACHWCHSPANQSVTGSDVLHVGERKPPAKSDMGWSHQQQNHLHCLSCSQTSSSALILYFLILGELLFTSEMSQHESCAKSPVHLLVWLWCLIHVSVLMQLDWEQYKVKCIALRSIIRNFVGLPPLRRLVN